MASARKGASMAARYQTACFHPAVEAVGLWDAGQYPRSRFMRTFGDSFLSGASGYREEVALGISAA